MLETEKDDTYFKYKDYAEIKERFLKMFSYSNTFDTNFLEQALNELKSKSQLANSFRDIFKELQKHLVQDSILVFGDTNNGCKYINYVLNKEIRKIISYIHNETTFNLFKQFEQLLRIEKGKSKIICDLYYISDDIYNKMDKLYYFYDKFRALKQNNSKPNCLDLSEFVFSFKDYIWAINDNGSDIIKNKLTNFIDVIKNHKWATNKECKDELSQIASQKVHFSVEEEVLRAPNPSPSLQSTSLSSSHPQSVTVDASSLHTNGLEPSEAQSYRKREPITETLTHTRSLHSADTQDNLVTLLTTEEEPSTEVPQPIDLVSRNREQSTLKARDKPHEQYARNLLHIKGQYDPKLSSHQGILEFPNTENEISVDKGYLRRVTDAVSGFMEGVDPVPVVGVSGGMGALFLLFRVLQILNLHLYIYI
ncbi:hypothetical protein PVMG_05644 [Plasmodium vivax Mauritania I]|uniref:Uncharacterized protein n=1 Tax=Plasmodium vivax Mauritania I TaxID=1035515 RepID=A0A0J9TH85_PLAVI|nr:hypothetical protein PVMG_05644 [Plasmodium vivax Mauritania I]